LDKILWYNKWGHLEAHGSFPDANGSKGNPVSLIFATAVLRKGSPAVIERLQEAKHQR